MDEFERPTIRIVHEPPPRQPGGVRQGFSLTCGCLLALLAVLVFGVVSCGGVLIL